MLAKAVEQKSEQKSEQKAGSESKKEAADGGNAKGLPKPKVVEEKPMPDTCGNMPFTE